jgi:Na+/H+ antiporter NhaD/arsenite permease-like protein
MFAAALVLLVTYLIIGIQRIPRVHIDRPSGALLGAVGMVGLGVLTLGEAYAAIDLDTISFLLGMMILIAYFELSGFFEVLERWIIGLARSTRMLLLLVVLSSGLLSALFMNDTICLLYTPVIVRVTKRLGLNPVPYLIALVTSANIGSVATIIGNPQNVLIGLRSGISFLDFTARLWPVALIGLGMSFLVNYWVYRGDISGARLVVPPPRQQAELSYWMLSVSLCGGVLMLLLLILDYHPPSVAMTIASLLILAGSRKPRRALGRVDWTLLLLFAGLFIVMRGVEEAGIVDLVFEQTQLSVQSPSAILGFVGGVVVVSNVVSNVPAVMLYSPIIPYAQNSGDLWLLLAMASTLAGNLTLIGSMANLIVVQTAREDVQISFFEYLKVGLPLTLLSIAAGTAYLVWMM